jgi:hypothetical protein
MGGLRRCGLYPPSPRELLEEPLKRRAAPIVAPAARVGHPKADGNFVTALQSRLVLAGPRWETYGHHWDDPADAETEVVYLLTGCGDHAPMSPGAEHRHPVEAASVLLVVLHQHRGQCAARPVSCIVVQWVNGEFLGMDASFVLSGYLITSTLLTEWRRAGGIGLAGFWGRRARTGGVHLTPTGVRSWIAPWVFPQLLATAPK